MSSSESDSGSNLPLIGEHYQLVSKLGEGAFGEVYKAQHDLLGQDFAVKLLKPELSEEAADVLAKYYQRQRSRDELSTARTTVRLLQSTLRYNGFWLV